MLGCWLAATFACLTLWTPYACRAKLPEWVMEWVILARPMRLLLLLGFIIGCMVTSRLSLGPVFVLVGVGRRGVHAGCCGFWLRLLPLTRVGRSSENPPKGFMVCAEYCLPWRTDSFADACWCWELLFVSPSRSLHQRSVGLCAVTHAGVHCRNHLHKPAPGATSRRGALSVLHLQPSGAAPPWAAGRRPGGQAHTRRGWRCRGCSSWPGAVWVTTLQTERCGCGFGMHTFARRGHVLMLFSCVTAIPSGVTHTLFARMHAMTTAHAPRLVAVPGQVPGVV